MPHNYEEKRVGSAIVRIPKNALIEVSNDVSVESKPQITLEQLDTKLNTVLAELAKLNNSKK
jgi:hypothetical protein